MKKFLFVINPAAGKGRGARLARSLEMMLKRNGLQATTLQTSRKGDATEVARSSVADIIVAVGGDGTINEVVNGIVDSTKQLGIIPVGSGNDLIKSLGIPDDPEGALRVIGSEQGRQIDIGLVECRLSEEGAAGGNSVKRYFVNGMGIGFDAAVAAQASQIRFFSGTFLYLAAVLMTLRKYRSPFFTITGSDAAMNRSRRLLIAIGNGACAGGGFYLTPYARLDDGLLDLCAINDTTTAGVLGLIPRVLMGKHLDLDNVTFMRGSSFVVASEEPFPVHVDGEIIGTNVKSCHVTICRNALGVVAPHASLKEKQVN